MNNNNKPEKDERRFVRNHLTFLSSSFSFFAVSFDATE